MCTADCNPSCTTTWTGPNLPASSTSILNLQNIDRSQAGVYNCTAVNEISSLTLIKVNVIDNCKYELSMLLDIYVFITITAGGLLVPYGILLLYFETKAARIGYDEFLCFCTSTQIKAYIIKSAQ